MFIRVPVYFDIRGSVRDPGFFQDLLQSWIEQFVLGRKTQLEIDLNLTKKVIKEYNLDPDTKVLLIRKDTVLDGLR